MSSSDAVDEFRVLVERISVSGLALWGMAILDSSCHLLLKGANEGKVSFSAGARMIYSERIIVTRESELGSEAVSLLKLSNKILHALLIGQTPVEKYYDDIQRAVRLADGLTLSNRPFSIAAVAVYIFMTNVDYVCSYLLAPQTIGRLPNKAFCECSRVIPFVANLWEMPQDAAAAKAAQLAALIVKHSQRTSSDPFGAQSLSPIVSNVLRGNSVFVAGSGAGAPD